MPVSDTPRGREDVIFRQLADDWVLFDPRSNQIHVLNLSAALVWTACTGDASVDQIVEDVVASFPDDTGSPGVRGDVRDVLARFTSEGLLE